MSRRGDVATILIAATALTLVALCATVQWMMASGGIPHGGLLLEKTEGQVVWTWAAGDDQGIPMGSAPESGGILLALPEASKSVFVLINGQAVADFGYTRAAIVVHRGDLVEIEAGQGPPGNGQAATQLQVEVADTTPNVRAPRRGLRIQLSPGRTLLANIML